MPSPKKRALKFPTIAQVAAELREENATIRSYNFAQDPSTRESWEDEPFCDVRLQVYPNGDWAIRIGDAGWDQDHHGYWGASSLDGKRFDSRSLAKDLIDQCKDSYAEDVGADD